MLELEARMECPSVAEGLVIEDMLYPEYYDKVPERLFTVSIPVGAEPCRRHWTRRRDSREAYLKPVQGEDRLGF